MLVLYALFERRTRSGSVIGQSRYSDRVLDLLNAYVFIRQSARSLEIVDEHKKNLITSNFDDGFS